MGSLIASAADEGDVPVVDVPGEEWERRGVIRFLASWLASHGFLADREVESIVERVMHREDLGSTGVGDGVAVPHTSSQFVESQVLVAGRLANPMEWEAIDGEPVRWVVLIIDPEPSPLIAERGIARATVWLQERGWKS
jgi:mannitol/fructose-specific phosphotransferase system IIA component (Ntr-type)